MTTLRKSLADYLELRRGMGFKLRYYERRLGRFLSFVEERGAKKITTKLAIQFATHDSDLKPRTMAGRLGASAIQMNTRLTHSRSMARASTRGSSGRAKNRSVFVFMGFPFAPIYAAPLVRNRASRARRSAEFPRGL